MKIILIAFLLSAVSSAKDLDSCHLALNPPDLQPNEVFFTDTARQVMRFYAFDYDKIPTYDKTRIIISQEGKTIKSVEEDYTPPQTESYPEPLTRTILKFKIDNGTCVPSSIEHYIGKTLYKRVTLEGCRLLQDYLTIINDGVKAGGNGALAGSALSSKLAALSETMKTNALNIRKSRPNEKSENQYLDDQFMKSLEALKHSSLVQAGGELKNAFFIAFYDFKTDQIKPCHDFGFTKALTEKPSSKVVPEEKPKDDPGQRGI